MQDLQSNWPGFIAAVKTADAGSFSEAARQLNLTPAAVGKSIALLEARLGVRLFNRTTRQLSLTSEGERVLERARFGLQALADAVAQARPEGELGGMVRLSSSVGFGRKFVLPALADLMLRHPGLRLELSLSDLNADLVKEGFDIGIRGGSAPPQGMVARRICKIPTVLVASPTYLARKGMPRNWTDLANHNLIGVRFASGRVSEWSFRIGTKTHTLQSRPGLQVSAPEVVLDAALLHQGIAQAAAYHVNEALESGALVQVLKGQHLATELNLTIFYPHRSGLAPRVRAVVDHLLLALQGNPLLMRAAAM